MAASMFNLWQVYALECGARRARKHAGNARSHYFRIMTEKDLIRKAMAALGRRTSEAKTKAARENAKLPRKKPRKTPSVPNGRKSDTASYKQKKGLVKEGEK
jgi:hypothetical protein